MIVHPTSHTIEIVEPKRWSWVGEKLPRRAKVNGLHDPERPDFAHGIEDMVDRIGKGSDSANRIRWRDRRCKEPLQPRQTAIPGILRSSKLHLVNRRSHEVIVIHPGCAC